MPRSQRLLLDVALGVLLFVVLAASSALGEEHADPPQSAVTLTDDWSCVLSEQTIPLRCAWSVAPAIKHIDWRLTASSRPLERGSVDLTDEELHQGHSTVQVKIPKLRDGVSFNVRFEVSADEGALNSHKVLHVFGADPFAGRKESQRSITIQLFDPTGNTFTVLEEAGYVCKRLRNLAALESAPEGIVVVGQNLQWSDHQGLSEVLGRLASRGMPVLCLAPANGSLGALASGDDENEPQRLLLVGSEIIKEYDSRLDSGSWLGGTSVATRFNFQAVRDSVGLNASSERAGWPYVLIEPSDASEHTASSWVLCGFDLVGRWNDGPVPRYLLAAMLSSMASKSSSSFPQHKQVSEP